MSFSLLSTFYLIGFSQALFFIAILLKKNKSKAANKILVSLLAVLAYKLLEGSLIHSGLYLLIPHLLDWIPAEALLIGPLCFAYVRSLSEKKSWSQIQWFVHLGPAMALTVYNFPNLFVSADIKIAMWDVVVAQENPQIIPIKFIVLLLAIKFHLASYLFFAWQHLSSLEKLVENNLSDNSVYLIHWQKHICILFITLEAVWVVLFMLQNLGIVSTLSIVGNFWLLLVAAVIFNLSYLGLQNIDVISLVIPEITHQPRYQNSPLSDEAAEEIVKLIQEALQDKQLYLQPGLKLTELAETVGAKHHLVSQVINETMNTRFNSLVNRYRAEYAMSLLKSQAPQFTIERLSIESGFSNRVTFNKVFKAKYGMSPSGYKAGLNELKPETISNNNI